MYRRTFTLLLLCVPGAWVVSPGTLTEVVAQAPSTCTCATTDFFGSCEIAEVEYPGQEPGTAAVVPVGAATFLYVADLSDGFLYRYRYSLPAGPLELAQSAEDGCMPDSPACFVSPMGSLPTPTGLAFNTDDGQLYWALGGFLFRSDPDVSRPDFASTVQPVAEVDMAELARLLDLPETGTLGGITYHSARSNLWGVDIVNDVYFEFSVDGKPVAEGDRVVHFRNPRGSVFGGGAFGNTISYVEIDGTPYFDIDVGELVAGGVTHVERVHAADGEQGGMAFSIGDPTGIFYPVRSFVEEDAFIAGLAHWANTCGDGQNIGVLLEHGESPLDDSEDPEEPRIHLISADPPASPGLASFECQSEGNNVRIRWKTFADYKSLVITRDEIITGQTQMVLTVENGTAGEEERLERNVSDGAYHYSARLTTMDDKTYAERLSRVTVGRGSVVASTRYLSGESPENQDPFAITYIGSRNLILVADHDTGNGHLYDLDLQFQGAVTGPFSRTVAFIEGNTTGVAWSSTDDSIYWLLNRGGENFLQRTSLISGVNGLEIRITGDIVRIRTPLEVFHPVLGDLDHDPGADQFWAVDRHNSIAYSIRADGSLSGRSFQRQLPNPRTEGLDDGLSGGGIAVVRSEPNQLVLDWLVGSPDDDLSTEVERVAYSRNLAGGQDEVFVPGQSEFQVDVTNATLSLHIAGVEHVASGQDEFQFVVSADSQTIYKLDMSEGIAGREFRRGDANADGSLNISDPSSILEFLFKGGNAPPCEDAADVSDDENIDITDAVAIFLYLFLNGPPPVEPFESCGRDFDEGLGCNVTTCP